MKEYPFRSRFVEIAGQRLHYVDEGSGETLLFLHGNPTWSYLWRHQIASLSRDHRCVALDHLGFGFSDKPRRGDYSMRAHIMRLDAFVERLDLRDVTLVAQDWGGIIGLGWAVHHRARVRRLVIVNSAGCAPPGPRELSTMRPIPWALALLWALRAPGLGELFVQGMNGFVRFLLPLGLAHRERLRGEVKEGYLAPYQSWGSRRAHLASARQVPLSPRHPTHRLLTETGAALRGWEVPALLLWGTRDPVFVPWFRDELARRLPRAEVISIADGSHFLPDDTPEEVTRALRAFLERTAAGGASKDAQVEGGCP